MFEEIDRILVKYVIGCAMSKQPPHNVFSELELFRKILHGSSLGWEIIRDANAHNGV